MTSKTDGTNSWTLTWDDDNRLTRVQGPGGVDVSYQYDSLGRMLTRTSGGVTTKLIWEGRTCVKEITGSSVTRYIAPQGEIHSFERDGQVYQVHADGHNGSVRAITDATGAVVAHYELDAWGAQLGSSSPFSGGFAFGYVGGLGVRTDAATGLLYMRHRWFDPNRLQRFLSRDVLGSLNRYEYCYNNPVSWVDLDGLEPQRMPGYPDDWRYDVEDGISSYKNGVPNTLAKPVQPKPIQRKLPIPDPIPDPVDNKVQWTVSLPKPYVPFGPPLPGKPFPGTGMRCPEDSDIERNMRRARNMRDSPGKMRWFYKMVRNRGPWDYKQQSPAFESYGNFHFGAVGRALGISEEILQRGAGFAQRRSGNTIAPDQNNWGGPPYGDDPRDQIRIHQGYEWARQHGY